MFETIADKIIPSRNIDVNPENVRVPSFSKSNIDFKMS